MDVYVSAADLAQSLDHGDRAEVLDLLTSLADHFDAPERIAQLVASYDDEADHALVAPWLEKLGRELRALERRLARGDRASKDAALPPPPETRTAEDA